MIFEEMIRITHFLSEIKILPSILILNEQLEIEWEQRGRNALFYGDPELMKILKCSSWI